MKAEDCDFWEFSQPLTDDSLVECFMCVTFSPISKWTEGSSPCYECGSHDAIVCPECGYAHDHTSSAVLNCKEPEK